MSFARVLPGFFQRFDQEEDFGGHIVGQIRGVIESAVGEAMAGGLPKYAALEENRKKLPPRARRHADSRTWHGTALIAPRVLGVLRFTIPLRNTDQIQAWPATGPGPARHPSTCCRKDKKKS
ncbi:MAG: hypothetical protein ABSC03_17275 [Verrucomicrobiota bacterium]|jgi:hypothetical protein